MNKERPEDKVTRLFGKESPAWQKKVNDFLRPLEDKAQWADYQTWAVYTLPSDAGSRSVHVLYGQGSRVASALRTKIENEEAHPHNDLRGLFEGGAHIDGYTGGPEASIVQNVVRSYVRAHSTLCDFEVHFAH